MELEWLYNVNLWIIFPTGVVLALAAIEVGYFVAQRWRPPYRQIVEPQIRMLQAAFLGLLSLLIAFTFSMAVTRFDVRTAIVLEEANAIGTAALRAGLLPAPQATELERLLRDYVDARLLFATASGDSAALEGAARQSLYLQAELWRTAAVSAQDTRSVPAGLFIQSLNEVIDLHEKRMTALRNHVPEIIILLIYAIALLALGFTGYDCGVVGYPQRIPNTIMAVSLVAVLVLISDLDRPRSGLIIVSQQPMIDLQMQLAQAPERQTVSPNRAR